MFEYMKALFNDLFNDLFKNTSDEYIEDSVLYADELQEYLDEVLQESASLENRKENFHSLREEFIKELVKTTGVDLVPPDRKFWSNMQFSKYPEILIQLPNCVVRLFWHYKYDFEVLNLKTPEDWGYENQAN